MRRIYLLTIFIFSFSLLFGQIDNEYIRINIFPEDVRPCDTSYVEVEVLYKATELRFLTIQFNLPTGVTYVANSFEITSAPPNYSGSSPSTTINAPSFIIDPGGVDAGLGDVVRFRFAKRVGCDAIEELNSGTLFKDVQIVDLTHGGDVLHFENTDPNVSTYQVLIPTLAIQPIADKEVIVGQTISRDITIVQGGQGHLRWYQHKVTLGNNIGNYTLSFNGTTLTPDSTSGNELFYNVYLNTAPFVGQIGDGDDLWENGETIDFQETFQVQSCSEVDVIHQGFWGCSLSELCQGSSPETGVLNFKGATPEVTITKIAGDNYMDLCGGQNFTIRVENIATHSGAMAKDINVNLGLGHNNSPLSDFGMNPFWAFDWRNTRHISNIRINGNPVAISNWTSSIYPTRGSGHSLRIPFDYFTTDPDGPGGLEDIDGDGYYDDLAPGAHFDVSFDYEYTPRSDCGEKRFDYIYWEHLYIDVLFKDQCANEKYTERINFEYSNIIRDYLNETVTNKPNGVSDGEDFIFGLKPHFYRGGWTTVGKPRCNGEDLFTGANVVWSIEITVPNGVNLQAGAPAAFSQTGNTITYTQSGYQYKYYDFPLTFDCASYSGPEKFTISYVTHYHCTCWDADIHCGSIEIQNLCPTSCKGPSIKVFDTHRTVAGWTNIDKTTKVVLDDTYALDKYLAKDTMQVDVVGVIQDSMVQNLYFEIAYETESGGGDENLFDFIDGEITINDISIGSFSGAMTTAPTKTVVGPNSYKLTFDLSSYASLVSPSYKYGEGNENDTVSLVLNMLFTDNFNYSKYFKLKNITGGFFAKNGSSETGCGVLYEQVDYLKPDRATSTSVNGTQAWYCTPSKQQLFFTIRSDIGDIFPNEFRNPHQWDSTVIVIPTGASFTGRIDYFNYTTSWAGMYSESNDGVNYSVKGDSLILYPGPNFRNVDQRGTGWPRFRPEFVGNCEVDATTTYSYTVFYKEFAHVNPISRSKTSTPTFTYYRPQFELHSPHPIVTVVTNEPSIDVQICNTSPVDIDYNWVQVDVNPNFTVTKAFVLDDIGNEIQAANFTSSGGKTWVEAGGIAASGCTMVRIYGNITDCGDQTITVSNGWACLAYPTDYENLDPICYQQTMDINLSMQTAQIQVNIVSQPDSIVYCEQFKLGIEVNSAQVANLLNPYLLFDIPVDINNMTVDSIMVEYPKNSGIRESVPFTVVAGQLKVDLNNHSGIIAQGMNGSYLESQDEKRIATVDLYVALSCAFLNLSTIEVQGYAQGPCNTPAASNGVTVASHDLIVKGANTSYYVFSEFSLPDTLSYCGVTQTIDVQSTIIAGTTGVVDSAEITIPNGLNFVPGSFNCTGPNCATFEYAYSSGGQDHFVIAFPQGVGNKDSIEYQFDVVSGNSYCSDMESFDIESYIYSTGGTCGTAECAATRIVTGHQVQSLVIAKPDLVIQNTTVATTMVTSAGDTKYGINLNIKNIGIDATSGYDYTIYCADGSGNPGVSIFNSSFSDILPSGDSLSQIFYFYASTACDPANGLVVEIVPSSSNCLCDVVRVVVPLTPGMNAVDDNYTTPEDTPLTANVTDNDTPTVGITVNTTPLTNVTNGTLTLNADGSFTYTPNQDYNGTDSFVYEVCDSGDPVQCDTATVHITITPVTDPPTAIDDDFTTPEDTPLSGDVSTNDSDPDGGVLTYDTAPVINVTNGTLTLNADGTFDYIPNLNYVGVDSFEYKVCNDGTPSLCDTAMVYITVTPVNDKPVAEDDNYTTPEDITLTGNVADNDTDVEGGITVNTTPISGVAHGTLTLNADGSFTYVPDLNYVGPDEFTYQICDLGTPALCDTAVAYITVTPVNDKPIAVDDDYTTPEDTPLSGNVMDNDTDVEGGLSTNTTPLSDVVNGTLTLNADGSFLYSPDLNYVGLDSFTYVVCDGGTPALCDTAVAYITVTPVNDKPVAEDDNYTTPEDSTLTGNVADNDTDVEGGITVNTTPISGVAHGTLTLNADGSFTYVPDLNYVGADEFTYQICDLGTPALCDTAVAYITVTPVNDKPIAVDDNYYTDTNTPLTTENVLDNDNDLDGDGLVVNTTPLNGPLYGTLILNADGTFIYTPALNFNGYDQFDYVVCDTGTPTLCDTATVYIKIGNVEVLINQPDTLDCATPTVTLDGSNSSQGVSFTYTWTTSNGNIVSGGDTWIAVVDMPGDYTLTILDTVSSVTATSSVTVMIDTLAPTAFIVTPDKITCTATTVFLSGNGSEVGTNITYQWTTTSGALGSDTNAILAEANQVGDYQLEVTNTLNGCAAVVNTTVEYDTVAPTAIIAPVTEDVTCTNQCIQLDASASSAGSIYLWTTTNGNIQNGGNTLQPTVCAGGQYDLVVTDISNGCTASAQATVVENTTPPAITMASNQEITCTIQQVYIEAAVTSGSGDYSYSWSPAASIVSGATTSNPLVNQPTSYAVTVTDNVTGCENIANVVVQASIDFPQVNLFALDTITCADSIVTVNATFNSAYQVVWSTNDGVIVGADTLANVFVSEPGTYQAVVTNPSSGCESTSSVEVVTNIDAPVADASEVQKQDCNTTLVQLGNLENAQLNNVHFIWTTLDGHFVSSGDLPNPIVDQVGTYRMVAMDMHTGCTTEDEVEVISVAPLSGADFTVSLPGCNGKPGAIIVNEVEGSAAPFLYSFDNGEHFGTMPITDNLQPGDYDVIIQDDLGCEYKEVINIPEPKAGDVLVGKDVEIVLGDSTVIEVFSSTPMDAIDTIIWEPANNLSCFNNCFEQTVGPLVTTIYDITIVDTLGCVSRAKSTVHVADPDIFIPNVFSPNDGDGQNDKFTVMGNSSKVVEVESIDIFDRWGEHVFSKKHIPLNNYSEGWDGTFRGKPVPEGVYIYQINVRYVDGRVVPFQGDINILN